nr:hypothetical protein CFP56_53261 [Quercus suber]
MRQFGTCVTGARDTIMLRSAEPMSRADNRMGQDWPSEIISSGVGCARPKVCLLEPSYTDSSVVGHGEMMDVKGGGAVGGMRRARHWGLLSGATVRSQAMESTWDNDDLVKMVVTLFVAKSCPAYPRPGRHPGTLRSRTSCHEGQHVQICPYHPACHAAAVFVTCSRGSNGPLDQGSRVRLWCCISLHY